MEVPFGRSYIGGQFRKLREIAGKLVAALPERTHVTDYADPLQRARYWSEIVLAHSHIQLGAVDQGIRLLRRLLLRIRPDETPELAAWVYNLLSVAEGKIGREDRSQNFGKVAISLARRTGLYWLACCIELRLLHRAGTPGKPVAVSITPSLRIFCNLLSRTGVTPGWESGII